MILGRDVEVSAALAAVRRHEPVAIHGEAGIGKTAMGRAVVAASGLAGHVGGALATLSWFAGLPLSRAIRRPLPAGDRSATVQFVTDRVAGGILVLEDLQWADHETLRIIPMLAGQVPLIITYRDHEPGTPAAAAAATACGAADQSLAGLRPQAASALIRERNPALPEDRVAAIVAGAGGNPLYLEEQARQGGPGGGLSQLMTARLARCSPAARRTIAVLALLGRPCSAALAGPGVPELVEAGLAELPDPDADLVRLRHGLTGDLAVAGLDAGERRRLHAEVASQLTDDGEAARHHAAAGQRDAARSRALAAASQAQAVAERARHLGLAASCADGAEADELRISAAAAFSAVGEHAVALQLLDAVPEEPGSERRGRICLYRARARLALGEPGAALAAADAGLAVASAGASAGASDGGTQLAVALRVERVRALAAAAGATAQVRLEAHDAVAGARAAGAGLARSLLALGQVELLARDRRWPATVSEALTAARRDDLFDAECEAAQLLVTGHLLGGDPSVAGQVAAEMADRARDRGQRGRETEFRAATLWLQQLVYARRDTAERSARELLAGVLPAGVRERVTGLYALSLADAGDFDGAARALGAARGPATVPGQAFLTWVRAELAWLAGDLADARKQAAAAGGGLPPVDALAAVTSGWAHAEAGAVPLLDLAFGDYGGAGQETAAIGALAADPAAAAAEFAAAAASWRPRQLRAVLRCGWAAAEANRRAGAGQARAQLEAAAARAAELGLGGLLPRIHRSLRAVGARPSAARSADERHLTHREREILGLVATGHTAAVIAGRLAISAETVEDHIASAIRKLGAANRTEAVALLLSQAAPAARDAPPVIVVEDAATARRVRAQLDAQGLRVIDGFEVPGDDFGLAERKLACVGEAADEQSRRRVILAATRGAALVVTIRPGDRVPDAFLGDLERVAASRGLGGIDWRVSAPDGQSLTDEMALLLERLGSGETVAEAARALNLSLRGAHRRLASARAVLGVSSNRAAVAEATRRAGAAGVAPFRDSVSGRGT